jgi:lactate dehydrogenase-like 2-hydroxyacid dehydrogenase
MNPIILTDNKKISELNKDFLYVSKKNINAYDNNDVIAIVCSRGFTSELKKYSFPNLKLIQLTSAGWDKVDLPYFRDIGVDIANAGDVYSIPIAEFVVFLMLMSAKRYNKSIKSNAIRLFRGYNYLSELNEKRVGIMGVGSIGKEVAQRLKGFNMEIRGYSKNTKVHYLFDSIFTKENYIDFLNDLDYLVVTLPENNDTIDLIDINFFKHFKDGITIVNVGRNSVFNKNEFLRYLKDNKNSTATLDMFELLPNAFTNPYRRMKNVKVVPGVTAISKEVDIRLNRLVLDNIRAALKNEPIQYIINS